jgi:putative Mn2+ efflux pump MntP
MSSFAAFFGTILLKFLSKHTLSMLSMVLLITIGLWIMIEPYIKKESTDQVQTNDSKETNI